MALTRPYANTAIKRRLEGVIIYRNSSSVRDPNTGRTNNQNHMPIPTKMAVTNPTGKDLLQLPEGERSTNSKMFWSLEPIDTTDSSFSDVIFARGFHWKLAKVMDREEGGFWKAIGIKFVDAENVFPVLP